MRSNLLFLVRRWSSGRLRSNLHALVNRWSSGRLLSNLHALVSPWSSGWLLSNLHTLVRLWSSGWLLSNLHALVGQGDEREFAAGAGDDGTSDLGPRLGSNLTASPVSSSVSGELQ